MFLTVDVFSTSIWLSFELEFAVDLSRVVLGTGRDLKIKSFTIYTIHMYDART